MVKIVEDIKLDYSDVLLKPQYSEINSRKDVDLVKTFHTKYGNSISVVPIAIANMDSVGTFEMLASVSKHGIITCIHKHYSIQEWLDWSKNQGEHIWDYVAISTGISDKDIEKTYTILTNIPQLKIICVDVANGYSSIFSQKIREIRENFSNHIIIAGNVVTGELTQQLILSGADIIKVGIGPGSVCTTRSQTGVGYPQLSAVIECCEVAKSCGGMIMADGGCTCPGDFVKAFGAGAHFVMSGGYFSGHTECGGEEIRESDGIYKIFYGMSSKNAMDKYSGGVANYRSSEGKCVKIKYKGDVVNTILDLLGGIRSACTYVGAKNLYELPQKTVFIKVNRQFNTFYS